jgi:hypothetical protein
MQNVWVMCHVASQPTEIPPYDNIEMPNGRINTCQDARKAVIVMAWTGTGHSRVLLDRDDISMPA